MLRGIAFVQGLGATRGGFVYDRRTNTFTQQLTLTNDNSTAVTGPVDVALDDLSSNATLSNSAGATVNTSPTGSPYVVGVASGATFQPGSSTVVTLQFANPTKASITYSTRMITGTAP